MKADERTLGVLIEEMRTAKGLSRLELAIKVHTDETTLRQWEYGWNIRWAKFLEIARVLGYITDIEVKGGAE